MSPQLPTPSWQVVPTTGRPIRVMLAGDGDPLVFLHGWGLSPRAYTKPLLGLCAAGLQVIAPALPGFGGSAALPLCSRGLDGYARALAELLEALPLRVPAFVVGHSFGGGVALRLARQRPDLLRSLTLVNTIGGARRSGGQSWLQWGVAAIGELHPAELARVAPPVLRDMLPNLLRSPVTALATGASALGASLAGDARAVVASGVPVLFVWSEQDGLLGPGSLGEIAGALPAETVRGHHGWLIASPEVFSELLRNALTVHAMAERRSRGQSVVLPSWVKLADLLPRERRRRARRPGTGHPAPTPGGTGDA